MYILLSQFPILSIFCEKVQLEVQSTSKIFFTRDDAEKDCGKTNCSRRNQAVVGMPNNAFRNEMATLLYSQFNNEFEFGSSIPGTKIRLARYIPLHTDNFGFENSLKNLLFKG